MTIIKNSMADLRNLSSGEIALLQSGDCEYVELTGYHDDLKYDRSVQYYLSQTTDNDDDFSVIEVGSIKLEHNFGNSIDLIYCGVRGDGAMDEIVLINNTLIKLNNKGIGNVIISGIYYLYPIGTEHPVNQIKLQSNTNYFLNGTVASKPSRSNDDLILIKDTTHTKLFGGKIIGNKYCFLFNDGSTYYKMWQANKAYVAGEYVYVNRFPLKVIISGVTGDVKPSISNSQLTDGTITYEITEDLDLGEWGAGISILNSDNFHVEGVEISECWGDGIYVNEAYDGEILNVNCHDNRRQGISVIRCDGLNIVNSRFNNTSGTTPESGIDLEPNVENTVRNVNIVNCQCDKNEGFGVLITTPDSSALMRDVNIVNLTTRNNITDGLACWAQGDSYYQTIFNVNVNNITSTGNHASQINIKGTNGVKITKGRAENSSDQPVISVYRARNLKISELDIVGSGDGIVMKEIANNVSLKDNYIETAGRCITDDKLDIFRENVIIKENTLKSGSNNCIDLFRHKGLNIDDNTILQSGKDGIALENVIRTNITKNRINNVGSINNGAEYAHIRISGQVDVNEIICENNILTNDPTLVPLPVGVNASTTNLNYSTFKTLHSYNWSNFGPDNILSHPTIHVEDIR